VTGFIVFPILGAIAGFLGGLLGVGGGVIVVPVLIMVFTFLSFDSAVLTHMAIGTSLATIILTSVGAVVAHHRKGAVRWDIFYWYAPGLALGALFGAEIADLMPGRTLQIVFGIFSIVIAIKMGLNLKVSPHRQVPQKAALLLPGTIVGCIASLFGIGGGSLTVPFLSWCNVKMQQAVATSSAGGLPIAISGALGFVITGWSSPELPAWSVGYVYLPALLGVGIFSAVFAQYGAMYAHKLPAKTLKRVFSILLVVVGLKLIVG